MERKHYFILRSLVAKYRKDNVINTVNKFIQYSQQFLALLLY